MQEVNEDDDAMNVEETVPKLAQMAPPFPFGAEQDSNVESASENDVDESLKTAPFPVLRRMEEKVREESETVEGTEKRETDSCVNVEKETESAVN